MDQQVFSGLFPAEAGAEWAGQGLIPGCWSLGGMMVAWGIAGNSPSPVPCGGGETKTPGRGKIIGKRPSGRAGVNPCPQITFDGGTAAGCALVGYTHSAAVGTALILSPCPPCRLGREGEGLCWEQPPCSPWDERLPGELLTC